MCHIMSAAHLAPDSMNILAAMNLCRSANQWRWSWVLLGMPWKDLRFAEYPYNSAVATGGQDSQWPSALTLFHAMPSNSIQHSIESFGAAMGSICEGGNWELALSLLLEMDVEQIQPNVVVFNSLLGACKASSQRDSCFEFWVFWCHSGKLYCHYTHCAHPPGSLSHGLRVSIIR